LSESLVGITKKLRKGTKDRDNSFAVAWLSGKPYILQASKQLKAKKFAVYFINTNFNM